MILVAALVAAAPAVTAATVYLNGVDISGVRNRTFKEATVFIDHNGDVHINSSKYKVKVVDDGSEPTGTATTGTEAGANPRLASRYFLATRPSKGGRAQYDLIVKINGIERKLIKSGSPTIIMEISAWFVKGENKVEIIARKNPVGGRKSVSSSDKLEILIGAGHEEGSIIKMDLVHVSFKCNASQITEIKKRYTINAI
jgi:hypothetical protein